VVAQPTYEIGQQAVNLLRRRLDEPQSPAQTVVLPTQLIVRQSCGSELTNHTTKEVMPGTRKPQQETHSTR
jgi:hypothetical protein